MISANQITEALPLVFQGSDLPLPGKLAGKVRDGYPLPGQRRLLVTTDRLSAFDRVLAHVPFKGQVLNQLAAWWFEQAADIIPHHLVSTPDPNAAVVIETEPFPIEVIVRGYITGVTSTALWHRYSLGEREIYGHHFPEGLQKNQALPMPILTPTTKDGPSGHDERLTCDEVVAGGYLDAATWEQVSQAALALFQRGQAVARQAGLILVDTKYEFGRAPDGRILLIDEVHTPDSSRFWKASSYTGRLAGGEEPEIFDKESVRLAYTHKGYRGDGDAPKMPPELWVSTAQLYVAIYEMLTGRSFAAGEYPVQPRLAQNLHKAGIL